jgi:alkylation response protein AidB-like acyl-CoA dehydrogenase
MYFLPTSDQSDLQRGVRDLLDDRFGLDRLPDGFDADLWDGLTEVGVFGLRTELGLGHAECVLVFEELGRAAVPGPLVATMLAAGHVDGPVAYADPHGSPLLVAHLDVAKAVLVLDDAGARIVPPMPGTALLEPLDPLTPLHEVTLPDVAGDPLDLDVAALRASGAVLTAALQVGLASRLTELAVDYAKQREQFGKVIGSFQAVKHICADMYVRAELARAAVHAAALTIDDPSIGDLQRATAGAKLLADEAATLNGRSCVQVHGGMGFTWEVPVHYLLKRAWVHATEFGTPDEQALAVADRL